jgi:hypothetical protein
MQGSAVRESNAQGPDAGDDDDLPKRRGWWQRWV